MKANFHKIISMTVLGLALYAQGTSAWAGVAHASPVSIRFNGSTPVGASGTLTGARYSPDNVQSIGCNVISPSNDPSPVVLCSATNRVGKSVSCSTVDTRFADAVKGMTDSSFISFNVVGGNLCTELEVINASHFLR